MCNKRDKKCKSFGFQYSTTIFLANMVRWWKNIRIASMTTCSIRMMMTTTMMMICLCLNNEWLLCQMNWWGLHSLQACWLTAIKMQILYLRICTSQLCKFCCILHHIISLFCDSNMRANTLLRAMEWAPSDNDMTPTALWRHFHLNIPNNVTHSLPYMQRICACIRYRFNKSALKQILI